ncbi:sulfotransferase domain-containing protein [Salinibacter ruber]|uniref:sulfotransferase domain-containing protein n=1 Tax=Salinibacter ruber TaxID=146919 RepID=UPI0013C2DB86|nr:sulfotransferase domain-containing protein [Salinibacter ruber]
MSFAIRPAADAVLRAYGAVRANTTYDIQDTIVVASTGRGGSTWLTEILATLPGYTVLWEPLHLGNNPACEDHGFDWQNYIPRGAAAPSRRAYLQQLLTGENLSTQILTSLEFRPSRLLQPAGGYLVKFVNANMMLPWITDTFPVSAVLMIRHPCAVVASQMKHGAWGHVTKDEITVPNKLFERYPHLPSVYESIEAQEEVLAFEWALQTYVPLQADPPRPWFLTSYEDLVVNGPSVVESMFEHLGHPVPDAAYEQLHVPSATSSDRLQQREGTERLRTWRERLSPQQADRILSVARDVGVTCYDNSLRPDHEALGAMTARDE